ncbi:MAG: ATP-binding protein, partial [Kovacikia sp.]
LNEAKMQQALETIERNAKLQSELIEDLLDVSRILQGKLSLNTVPVNLATTVQAAIETVRLAAEAKAIDLRFEVSGRTGERLEGGMPENPSTRLAASPLPASTIQIAGDPNRLQQVVWNLLSNAVKFTPTGGRVEVRLERIEPEKAEASKGGSSHKNPSPPPAYAQITITDTGKGIHPRFLPHVFEYFRQADCTTTRQHGGLGLGLAIVHHLVELHGGTVEAASAGEGLGATFTVRLPLMPTPSPGNAAVAAVDPVLSLNGLQILVVDDVMDTLEFVAFLLEQAGASVLMANSATEALTILPQAQPHLLLSDIGMPDMDGYMLIQRVRALPPEQGGNIPAIALTAFAGEMNQQQAIAAGFQMHLSKPVEPAHLISMIASLVVR